MDLGNLHIYWQAIDQEFKALDALPSLEGRRLLSARAFDQAQVAGPRTYMEVTRYLGVARDNHLALLALLKHHGATLWAPWSLLRPTFETSFYAAWLLDPDDGRERRTRGSDAKSTTAISSAATARPSRSSPRCATSSRRPSRISTEAR